MKRLKSLLLAAFCLVFTGCSAVAVHEARMADAVNRLIEHEEAMRRHHRTPVIPRIIPTASIK